MFFSVYSHKSTELEDVTQNTLSTDQVDVAIVLNPTIKKIIGSDMKVAAVEQYFSSLFSEVEKYDKPAKKIFFLVASAVFFLMLLMCKTIFSGITFSFANFGFNLSRRLIILAALITPICWIIFKYNLYTHISGISFWGPVVLLLSTSACLKIYDFNNPIWNRMSTSFICMTISAAIVHLV